MQPYGQQPTRLLCPQDSLGKNTGVVCHFVFHFSNLHSFYFFSYWLPCLGLLKLYWITVVRMAPLFCSWSYRKCFQFLTTENNVCCGLYDLYHVELGGSVVKNTPTNADVDSIPGSGRYPGEGNGNPLQYSCLGNPMDRGGWQSTVHVVTKVLVTT